MNVLSLFDGMSCGQIAINRAGIKYDKYFASEIDKHAIKVTMANYPNTVQLGDVTKINFLRLPKIDILIAGSPCQGFSFAGKQLNFKDPRSKLFFEFVKALKLLKPKYFLLENVRMKKAYQDIITKHLGVEPVLINSSLVSAQNRERLYWTNIPFDRIIKDKNIHLSSFLEKSGETINYSSSGRGDGIVESRISKAIKAATLTKTGYTARSLTAVSVERLPKNFFTDDAFDRNKMPKLLKDSNNNYFIINGKKFRKLSIIEMERLQTVSDNYTNYVSESQRSKMLGNGWTIDIIAHILSGIKNDLSREQIREIWKGIAPSSP